ncbi:MAG: dihydrofolate reductase [Emergencia sp.]|nr:dihydrofolate reductase [Emergencia sp.]
MKKFERLVMVDNTGTVEFVKESLAELAEEVVCYDDYPESEGEILRRIGEADAVLVSLHTKLKGDILSKCPKLRYIGLCCTYFNEASCNVDVSYCREHGIELTGVSDYGDYGVVEFVISELVQMVKGLGGISFFEEQRELRGMKLGVIGLGTLGTMIADAAAFFGMEVSYYNRRKKENCPYPYMEKADLLAANDVILTSIPRNQIVMEEEDFRQMGNHKIFFNVGVGPSFDQKALEDWIADGNYAVLDFGSAYPEKRDWYEAQPRISMPKHIAGFTWNARKRLGEKAVQNIIAFLNQAAEH